MNMKLWHIGQDAQLTELAPATLDAESQLEDWVANDVSLLGLQLLVIGRQITTDWGARIDILALDADANCVVVELKRDRTPRDVVAQVLDYASWVRRLSFSDLDSLAQSHMGKDLATAFGEAFDLPLPENVNVSHSMLIVASEFDESSERIVEYLVEEHHVNINAIFFSVFGGSQGKFLGRAWLMDPADVESRTETGKQAPWTGYWFVNVGEGPHRNWADNVKYGYIGAGQAPKYSEPLKKLRQGDSLFAYMKGHGYVGYGVVLESAKMLKDVVLDSEGTSLLDVPLTAPQAHENRDDPRLSEWAVRVNWIKTFDRDHAKTFKGVFANQNIVCKLRHRETLDFLKEQFAVKE